MSATMNNTRLTGRSRVMIVDPELQFGLKLADCLATNGYHAVLVRDLQSMLAELGEIQPEAILLSSESCDEERVTAEFDTLRALIALCPQAPVLTVTEPIRDASSALCPPIDTRASRQAPLVYNRIEELLRSTLGIPCVRASLTRGAHLGKNTTHSDSTGRFSHGTATITGHRRQRTDAGSIHDGGGDLGTTTVGS